MMNPERWQKINELYHVAIDLGSGERIAFLKNECGDDEKLFAEVSNLVAAHQEADNFIENAVADNALEVLGNEAETPDLVGKKFGVYEIIEEIGRGGMGAVYLAKRSDSEFEKQVAIKIIKRGMDTDAVLNRFRNERQILASLEHPNITRLLDGGTTDDGLPYFVMEYIKGVPITEFAESRRLSIDERLDLFRQVCLAITFAHQRLIIHRDIKPSNIIVTNEGVPKLLDFGIAKLMNPEGIGNETAQTATGLRLLTPEYASPEQIHGLQITTLSDIYSLGVVLYELLSGQQPYQFKQRSLFEIANIINTEEPRKPSEIATRRRGDAETQRQRKTKTLEIPASQLRGDLDNIVLMAMRKEPERRYSSVEQFSEDIRRHLIGLPVIARSLNLKYRFAKFALRNKTAVALGTLIFLTLVGGIITTTYQSIRANRQAELTEKRFNEVRKLAKTVLFDYHDAIKDLPGSTPVRERLVRDALEYLNGLASESTNDATLQLELAAAYERVGDVQGGSLFANLGNTEGAIESYRKALNILQTSPISDTQTQETLTANASASQKLGGLLWEKGDTKSALEETQKSKAIYEKLFSENPTNFDFRYQYGGTIERIGQILLEQGDLVNAQKHFEQDIELLNGFSATEKKELKVRRSFSLAYEHLGGLFLQKADYENALENNTLALEIRQKLSSDFPDNADLRRTLSVSYYNQGEILAKLNRYPQAMDSYQKYTEIAQSLLAKDPSNEQYRGDTAYGLLRIGDMFVQSREYDQALLNYKKSQTMRTEDVTTDPTNLWKRSSLIESYAKIGKTLSKMGQVERGKAEAVSTFSMMEKTEVEPENAAFRGFFAVTFMDLGETYKNLAEIKSISSLEQSKFNASSCEMYQKSADIMQDMAERKMMAENDEAEFDKLKIILEKCK
jgi:eukaryotic-like serine/threonine-protein kinase